MTVLSAVYVFCLVSGLAYVLITALLGEIGGGDDFDIGDDFDLGGQDFDPNVDIDASGGTHLGPFSPMIIAVFLAFFGGTGFILIKAVPPLGFLTLIPSSGSGVVVAGVSLYAFNKFFHKVEGSSEPRVSRLLGLAAEVITTIPEGGAGEISYVARGTRFHGPSRSLKGQEIKNGTKVVIERMEGPCFIVDLHAEEKLHE